MKLKTLKDLWKQLEDEGWTAEDSVPTPSMIRDEAIKWIKELERPKTVKEWEQVNARLPELNMNEAAEEVAILTDWIKHFFNITKSDLNDKTKKM